MITATPSVLDAAPMRLRPEMQPVAFSLARACLYIILIGGPLAFGAVQAWAWGLISCLTSLALVFWAFGCVQRGEVRFVWSALYVPGIAVLVLALLQLRLRLSLDPIATREAAIKLATYLVLFFLAQQLFAEIGNGGWERFAFGVSIFAFALAIFAIIQFFASPGTVYGFIKPRWGGYIFGPYINHNNYAGLMEMLIPFPLALALGLERGHPAKLASVFAGLIALLSLLLSGSRGGATALVVELAIFAVIALGGFESASQKLRGVAGGFALLALVGCVFLWLDPGSVLKRWEQAASTPELAAQDRIHMTIDSLRMSRDHLASGVGLGSFERTYPKYQTVATDLVIDYAHDDYAQFFAETGLMGWIVAPLAILMFMKRAFSQVRERTSYAPGWIRLAAAVGVCGMLVHSFVDFNLHIAANAAWFAVCAALAILPIRDGGLGLRRVLRARG